MAISRDDIEHLALLGRLGISEEEKKKLEKDLERILKYVGDLEKVNTEGIEPMAGGTDLVNAGRGDEERVDTFEAEGYLLEQAPEKDNAYVKVPRVLG